MSQIICKPTPLGLSAPSIPLASRHGIGVRGASQLLVHVEPYDSMDEGDLIELFWDGCYVASKILKASDIGKPVVLRVPESFLQNGKARTYYRVMKIGGVPVTSPCRKLWVKLNAPGGQLVSTNTEENQGLAPLYVVPSVIRRGLSRRHLEGGLPMTIEPYLNMAVHDEITVRWGDLRMDLPPLVAEDVGEPVDLVVPPELILEGGEEQQLEVTYCVIDRVGNNSLWAPPRVIRVQPLGHSTD
ncbi:MULTISPECIES: hypothetical protein [Pseudomonas]|uniref:Uncharacterized protein n=4 Tax=Pseudomonas syringae group TaxID=136849 RepID=A0A7Z6XZH5_PSESF|nr:MULTISPECIES: hypothetical protein [Pseudomonas]KTB73504.1 hypothetical protein AO068_18805 [Pseudomonas sp. ICMP 3272]KTC56450.1 hypothetical protein AO258_23075 [Pseudomonas syringae ICMP 19498]KTC57508.1 hypothetical protein AO287_06520 [Pseudomonas savastanoi]MDU8545229.1 hypothetical protein [Pseudomonas syringae group sp. J248-6]QXW45370.1 hypothetical protein KXJ79_01740 [Pseudomonas amygdali]